MRLEDSASALKERGAKIKKLPYWEQTDLVVENCRVILLSDLTTFP